MDLWLLRTAATLLLLAVASYYDLFNKKNVPVMIPYAMIAVGLLFTLASLDLNVILYSCAIAVAVFALGYLVYRVGQLGGADVLVFTGLALLLPSSPQFPYPSIVPVFILSGFLAIIGLSAKYIPRVGFGLLKGKVQVRLESAFSAAVIFLSYLAIIYFFSQLGIFSLPAALLLLLLITLAGFLTLFKDYISSSMVEWVPVKEIDEEDVIDLQLMKPQLVAKLKLHPVLTPSEFAKLKKTGMKKFPIFKGMPPFLPYVLLAVLLLLLLGDPVQLLFTLPA